MLLSPLCVGRLGGLVELFAGPVEHEADVHFRVGLLDPEVLGSISRRKIPFDLKDEVKALQDEVRQVVGCTLYGVLDLLVLGLVLEGHPKVIEVASETFFRAGPEAALEDARLKVPGHLQWT